jgi:MoxR-like ATPase
MNANPEQLIEIVCYQARQLWKDPGAARHIAPVFAHGAPGIGKSSAFAEAARRLGVGFRDLSLVQHEPTDLRGLPVPDGGLTTWLPSTELPWDSEVPSILLLDELTSAERSVQAAAYQLVLDRRVGDKPISSRCLICAAGNRGEDRAITYTLSSALANRFLHVELVANVEQWIPWARTAGLPPEVIGFLRFRPERFFSMEGNLERGWPSPRTWEHAGRLLLRGDELSQAARELMLEGLLGGATAAEFAAFRSHLADLPDAVEMLQGRAALRVPRRADQRYALCAAMAWHLWRAPDELEVRVENFLRFGLKLGSDFATLAMVDATRGVPGDGGSKMARALFAHPLYEQWLLKHGHAWSEERKDAAKPAALTDRREEANA